MVKTPDERARHIEVHAAELQGRLHDLLARAAAEDWSQRPLPAGRLGPYITVSRQAGTGGLEIAHVAAARLGWTLLDREIVEAVAERLKVSPRMLELLDETHSNWFSDSLLSLLEPGLTIQDEYVALLSKVMFPIAYEGNVVIVGRGASFLLPREHGLAVRIVAPRESRVARMCEDEGLDPHAAAKRVDETDRSRAAFIRRHFRLDVDDPAHYDLVLDSGAFSPLGAAELVCRAAELRGLLGTRDTRATRR